MDFLRYKGFEVKKNSPMGEILFVGRNRQEICDIIEGINNKAHIRIQDGKDILIRFTDFDKILSTDE